jgi:hypothetical protein
MLKVCSEKLTYCCFSLSLWQQFIALQTSVETLEKMQGIRKVSLRVAIAESRVFIGMTKYTPLPIAKFLAYYMCRLTRWCLRRAANNSH